MSRLEDMAGAVAVEGALERMPAELRDALLSGSLLPNGWYPISWYRDLWRGVGTATGDDAAFNRRLARLSLVADVSTIYRPILRLLSPETVTSIGARHFNRIYNTGTMRLLDAQPRRLAVRFTGCRGFDRRLWVDVLGSIDGFMDLAGVKDPLVRFSSGGGETDDWAEATARWA